MRFLSNLCSFGGVYDLAVFHTSDRNHLFRQFTHFPAFSSKDDNFEAVVVVQMDVSGGHNKSSVVVLQFGQLVSQIMDVMVVNQCDRRGDLFPVTRPFILHERIPHQISDRLGTVGIPLLGNRSVETLQQIFGNRDRVSFHRFNPMQGPMFLEIAGNCNYNPHKS